MCFIAIFVSVFLNLKREVLIILIHLEKNVILFTAHKATVCVDMNVWICEHRGHSFFEALNTLLRSHEGRNIAWDSDWLNFLILIL